MVMSAFRFMILLCLLSVCTLVKSASILESSSDLWQNWLLNENEEIPSQQSSPLSRRITPKSVFVAPAFSRCSEGYRSDGMGNCVAIVRLNEAAQWESVLERLKQMSTQQFDFNKRQSQRNVSNSDGNDRINHKVSNQDSSNIGPFQLSIPFNTKNSSENQFQNDKINGERSSTEVTTTVKQTTHGTTTIESPVQQNTHFVDYTTEESTESQDLTTYGGSDYQEYTESSQYGTESINTEATVVDSTIEDFITESIPNVASHFADFDRISEVTEITTHATTRRIPNYSSVIPLKGVISGNKNTEEVFVGSRLTNSKPLSSYTETKSNINSTNVNKTTNQAVHISSNLNESNESNENANGDSTSASNDFFKKLPFNERTKPKCDPSNQYDCYQINIFPTNKPMFVLNRKPSTAFVRFPETPSKGLVRFPVQKVPMDFGDVAFAESNSGLRYWNRQYPTSWWSSWKSKPQFIQIVPETSAIYGVGDVNHIRSHPHFPTPTEWYNNK